MLRVTHLRKSFGKHLVLDIPEWEVPSGIYWIQGENGAGKSTLFRILAGIYSFEGEVWLQERYSLRGHPQDYRARIALAEAEPQFPGFLTPHDLLQFVSDTRKAPSGQCEALIEHIGIGNYLHQPFAACSSGMVKKVSLALAFLGRPELIILDEPLITIDTEARTALFHLIRESNAGFLLSSHQPFAPEEIPLSGAYRLQAHALVPLTLSAK